ncbi:hypothetical protein BH11PSE14_BH11PSE14_00640 [soil metagenome]
MYRCNATCPNLAIFLLLGLVLAGCSRASVADAPVVQPSAPTTIPEPSPAPAGEPLAFKSCAPQRPQACTREYSPVCATRDTGIRCITTPCPSSEQKTYSNGCGACADPKVSGWTNGACPSG